MSNWLHVKELPILIMVKKWLGHSISPDEVEQHKLAELLLQEDYTAAHEIPTWLIYV